MNPPIYTSCVDAKDYKGLDVTPEIVVAIAALVISGFNLAGLVISVLVIMEALHRICEYMLNGKLVCLGGDECAIGHVAGFETVDDKTGFDKIDNDFSINLLLGPWDLEDFTHSDFVVSYNKVATDGNQGFLVAEYKMPTPREAIGGKLYEPSVVEFPDNTYITYNPPPINGVPYSVPVFHCEIEGERLHLVCAALDFPLSLIPGGTKICKWKPFGISIGRWICAALSTIFLPFVLIALPIAWAAGSDDNRDFKGAGTLKRGDIIVVSGRWVYDAGHTGWNELHPVLNVFKIDEKEMTRVNINDLVNKWCSEIKSIPPVKEGTAIGDINMTPVQQQTYDNQNKPENKWIFHPMLDGCKPRKDDQNGEVDNLH
jgi:hypothetical protein